MGTGWGRGERAWAQGDPRVTFGHRDRTGRCEHSPTCCSSLGGLPRSWPVEAGMRRSAPHSCRRERASLRSPRQRSLSCERGRSSPVNWVQKPRGRFHCFDHSALCCPLVAGRRSAPPRPRRNDQCRQALAPLVCSYLLPTPVTYRPDRSFQLGYRGPGMGIGETPEVAPVDSLSLSRGPQSLIKPPQSQPEIFYLPSLILSPFS